MQIKTNKDMPMAISIMLNCADIDKLIRRLQHLKSHPKEHIDIFCTDFDVRPRQLSHPPRIPRCFHRSGKL